MNIKKYIKKINKVSHFSLLAIGFVVGLAVMYLCLQPKLISNEKTANDWKDLYNQIEKLYNNVTNYSCSQEDVKSFLKEYVATSSAYRWYLTGTASLACREGFTAYHIYETGLPTPTPEIIYKTNTQYVESPKKSFTLFDYGSFLEGDGITCYKYGTFIQCN